MGARKYKEEEEQQIAIIGKSSHTQCRDAFSLCVSEVWCKHGPLDINCPLDSDYISNPCRREPAAGPACSSRRTARACRCSMCCW